MQQIQYMLLIPLSPEGLREEYEVMQSAKLYGCGNVIQSTKLLLGDKSRYQNKILKNVALLGVRICHFSVVDSHRYILLPRCLNWNLGFHKTM